MKFSKTIVLPLLVFLLFLLPGVLSSLEIASGMGSSLPLALDNASLSEEPPYLVKVRFQEAGYLFGVVSDDGAHYPDLWQRGVRATTFEFQWKRYEPVEGVYDQAYIDHLKGILSQLNAQGWFVQMVPGFHYTPDWVFANHPDMAYVNQYGDTYLPDSVTKGEFRVINAPFNPEARQLISGYVARIFQDFDQSNPLLKFDSVRIGGGVQGELRYPPNNWNGHTNSYWAYDVNAQNSSVSGIPGTIIGWRPGIDPNPGTLGRGQLLINPGFEQTHGVFTTLGWAPDDGVSAQLSTNTAYEGLRALQLGVNSPNRIHQFVKVSPATTYQFGGWLKSGDGVGYARMFINQYDVNFALLSSVPFGKIETKNQLFTLVMSSIATSGSTAYLKVELDGDRPGTYFFDSLYLHKEGETNFNNRDMTIPVSFYDWYIQKLTDYQNWQISLMRSYFQGQLDIVLAGKGIRARQVTDALTNDLAGNSWVEASSALYAGADYSRHVNGLATTSKLSLYLTGIEDPPKANVDDTSPYASNWSAAHWLKVLATSRSLPIWGENSGSDSYEDMLLSFERFQEHQFTGLMWVIESQLYASPNPNGFATIQDYENLINAYGSIFKTYLPKTVNKR